MGRRIIFYPTPITFWNPIDDLPGLVAEYDPRKPDIVTSGGRVDLLPDQYGQFTQNMDLQEVVTANRPFYEVSGISGFPSFRSDPAVVTAYPGLETAATFNETGSVCIAFVGQCNTQDEGFIIGYRSYYAAIDNANNIVIRAAEFPPAVNPSPLPAVGNPFFYLICYNHTIPSISIYLNGTLEYDNVGFGGFPPSYATLMTHDRHVSPNAATRLSDFLLGSIVVTNQLISSADADRLNGYLAWEWGLENLLPGGHPYENQRP